MTITLKGKIDKQGVLNLKHPSFIPNDEVEVTVLVKDEKKYDFADLIGKLSWKGDAMKQQQEIRNEWK